MGKLLSRSQARSKARRLAKKAGMTIEYEGPDGWGRPEISMTCDGGGQVFRESGCHSVVTEGENSDPETIDDLWRHALAVIEEGTEPCDLPDCEICEE